MHDLNVLAAGKTLLSSVSSAALPARSSPLTAAALRQAIEGWADLNPAQRRALVTAVNHATHIIADGRALLVGYDAWSCAGLNRVLWAQPAGAYGLSSKAFRYMLSGLRTILIRLGARNAHRAEGGAGARVANRRAPLPSMHPNLAEVYRTKVAGLQEALTTSVDNAEVLEHLRDLVDRVDIGPGADRDQPQIILTGALAAMLKLAMPETTALAASGHDLFLSSVKLVAGARFERAAFRL